MDGSFIDTEELSARLRAKAVDINGERILLTRFAGSAQESDLTKPVNCDGFGRVHTFKNNHGPPWPWNPLPMEPAAARLGKATGSLTAVQVFQNAACNWRCWYCYVPYRLLAARPELSGWVSGPELVDLYLAEHDRCLIIDCSGGQPDLTPEWIPWMMQALISRGISDSVYLWSDDNLSNDYFWRYLSLEQRHLIASYRNYGRGCCLKGFDAASFSFNTKAAPELFETQFSLLNRLLRTGIDLYAYVTLTANSGTRLGRRISEFADRLQDIDVNLPLRLVPLPIERYGVVRHRVGNSRNNALQVQEEAIVHWNAEIARRYTAEQRSLPITAIPLGPGR